MKNLVVSTPLVLFSHTLSNVGYPMKVFGIPYFKVLARVARSTHGGITSDLVVSRLLIKPIQV